MLHPPCIDQKYRIGGLKGVKTFEVLDFFAVFYSIEIAAKDKRCAVPKLLDALHNQLRSLFPGLDGLVVHVRVENTKLTLCCCVLQSRPGADAAVVVSPGGRGFFGVSESQKVSDSSNRNRSFRLSHWFSPSFASPFRMLKLITSSSRGRDEADVSTSPDVEFSEGEAAVSRPTGQKSMVKN